MINVVPVEAYTTALTWHTNPPVKGPLPVEIDHGAGGNTLPLRTFKQMFRESMLSTILHAESKIKPPTAATGSLAVDYCIWISDPMPMRNTQLESFTLLKYWKRPVWYK